MGNVKLTTLTPAGGVSEMVRLSVAFPVGVQLVQAFFTPLHEERTNRDPQTRRSFKDMDFIQLPQDKFDHPFPRQDGEKAPKTL